MSARNTKREIAKMLRNHPSVPDRKTRRHIAKLFQEYPTAERIVVSEGVGSTTYLNPTQVSVTDYQWVDRRWWHRFR